MGGCLMMALDQLPLFLCQDYDEKMFGFKFNEIATTDPMTQVKTMSDWMVWRTMNL